MTEQTCPLCNNQIIPSIDRKGYWFCTDQSGTCMIHHKRYTIKYFNDLSSQIARIKETAFKEGCLKAKQEVFDEIDKNGQQAICYLCKGRPSHLEYYNEIKKKHGVE